MTPAELTKTRAPELTEHPELPKPDRHNLDFNFSIIPESWRGGEADIDKLRYASLRFATVLDLLNFEVGDLPNQTRHAMKARVSNFGVFLNNARNGIRHEMLPAAKHLFNHWVDNLSALGWNVLDSFFKAKDQQVFLHLIHLYDKGLITLPGCDKPLNECAFAEVVAAEHDQERQHWVEMQRQGKFIALTYPDTIIDAAGVPLEEITLAHFKLSRQAIQKAELIAYEAPDGRRLVLKDTTTGDFAQEGPVEQAEVLTADPT